MVDQTEYWKRVELAARTYLARPGATVSKTAHRYTVLPSDLRKHVLEIKKEQDEQAK